MGILECTERFECRDRQMVPKDLATAPSKLYRPFSPIAIKQFLLNGFIFNLSQTEDNPSAFNGLLTEGSARNSASRTSFCNVAWKVLRSFSTASKAFFLV